MSRISKSSHRVSPKTDPVRMGAEASSLGSRSASACQAERDRTFPARFQKPREYGSVKEIVQRAFVAIGGDDWAPTICDLLRIKKTQAYAMADQQTPAQLSLDRALWLTRYAQTTVFAEALAAAAGGIFIPAPSDGDVASLLALGAESNQEMADLIATIIEASADGKITPQERRKMLRKLDALLHSLCHARAKLDVDDQQKRSTHA